MMIVQNILASKVILTLGRVRDLYSRVEMEAGQDLIFAATNPFRPRWTNFRLLSSSNRSSAKSKSVSVGGPL